MHRKTISFIIIFCFLFEQAGFAQVAPSPGVPAYLSGLAPVADRFRPVQLRSVEFDPAGSNVQLLLDKGDLKSLTPAQTETSSKQLFEYFQIGLTLPNSMFWVNLRPDSPDEVIDPALEKTDLGKILLEADLQLKKDVSRFTSPDTAEGRQYWDKLYAKAEALYAGQDIEIPTLTRPWIVPGEIIIRESEQGAFIYKATLKVMLEQDYLKDSPFYKFDDPKLKQINEYSSELIRSIIIPKLTKEVNSSRRYAELRQVYYSLVLAQWLKSSLRGGHSPTKPAELINTIDQKNLTGLTSKQKWTKQTYYKAYQKSFQQGEYSKEETVQSRYGLIVRQYFSGGIALENGLSVSNIHAGVNNFMAGNDDFVQVTQTATFLLPEGVDVATAQLDGGFAKIADPASEQVRKILVEEIQEYYDARGIDEIAEELADDLLRREADRIMREKIALAREIIPLMVNQFGIPSLKKQRQFEARMERDLRAWSFKSLLVLQEDLVNARLQDAMNINKQAEAKSILTQKLKAALVFSLIVFPGFFLSGFASNAFADLRHALPETQGSVQSFFAFFPASAVSFPSLALLLPFDGTDGDSVAALVEPPSDVVFEKQDDMPHDRSVLIFVDPALVDITKKGPAAAVKRLRDNGNIVAIRDSSSFSAEQMQAYLLERFNQRDVDFVIFWDRSERSMQEQTLPSDYNFSAVEKQRDAINQMYSAYDGNYSADLKELDGLFSKEQSFQKLTPREVERKNYLLDKIHALTLELHDFTKLIREKRDNGELYAYFITGNDIDLLLPDQYPESSRDWIWDECLSQSNMYSIRLKVDSSAHFKERLLTTWGWQPDALEFLRQKITMSVGNLNEVKGGGNWTYWLDVTNLNGIQEEAGLHELTHAWYHYKRIDDPQFKKDFVTALLTLARMDPAAHPQYAAAIKEAYKYTYNDWNKDPARFTKDFWDRSDNWTEQDWEKVEDWEFYASMASFTMGKYKDGPHQLPPEMWRFYEPLFTGEVKARPYYMHSFLELEAEIQDENRQIDWLVEEYQRVYGHSWEIDYAIFLERFHNVQLFGRAITEENDEIFPEDKESGRNRGDTINSILVTQNKLSSLLAYAQDTDMTVGYLSPHYTHFQAVSKMLHLNQTLQNKIQDYEKTYGRPYTLDLAIFKSALPAENFDLYMAGDTYHIFDDDRGKQISWILFHQDQLQQAEDELKAVEENMTDRRSPPESAGGATTAYLSKEMISDELPGFAEWPAKQQEDSAKQIAERDGGDQKDVAGIDFRALPDDGERALRDRLRELGYDTEEIERWVSANKDYRDQLTRELIDIGISAPRGGGVPLQAVARKIRDALAGTPDAISFLKAYAKDNSLLFRAQAEILGFTEDVRLLFEENIPRRNSKKLAIVAYPKSDWNGAFYDEDNHIEELKKQGYDVVSARVGTVSELIEFILESTENRDADVLILGGHGSQRKLQLTDDYDILFSNWSQDEKSKVIEQGALRFENVDLLKDVEPRLRKDATVLLISCSTGSHEEEGDSLADLLAKVFMGRKILAPQKPAGKSVIIFDENGVPVDLQYTPVKNEFSFEEYLEIRGSREEKAYERAFLKSPYDMHLEGLSKAFGERESAYKALNEDGKNEAPTEGGGLTQQQTAQIIADALQGDQEALDRLAAAQRGFPDLFWKQVKNLGYSRDRIESLLTQTSDGGMKNQGGIDFRELSVTGQPAQALAIVQQLQQLAEGSKITDLGKEWSDIQKQIYTGAMPCARIKEFYAVCCLRNDEAYCQEVISCMIGLLRYEEEAAVSTSTEIKDLLVYLG